MTSSTGWTGKSQSETSFKSLYNQASFGGPGWEDCYSFEGGYHNRRPSFYLTAPKIWQLFYQNRQDNIKACAIIGDLAPAKPADRNGKNTVRRIQTFGQCKHPILPVCQSITDTFEMRFPRNKSLISKFNFVILKVAKLLR